MLDELIRWEGSLKFEVEVESKTLAEDRGEIVDAYLNRLEKSKDLSLKWGVSLWNNKPLFRLSFVQKKPSLSS